MFDLLALAIASLAATLPIASAGVATKSCPCYTATVTTTPEICPMCMPANCLVYPTITTTIPGPNPTCKETPTVVVSKPCPCGGDYCPTAWATETGKFTCRRGGTKETNIAGPAEPVVTEPVGDVPSDSGMMSILPIETSAPAV